ncbi:DUF4241 domain-containing protein [Paracoccus lutimaris]|uniref:Uncharacterized protein DUF4241 n=1 Tax=Paracoccus lutimaris TaxID=1490030 RepID=A0A368Z014_9RHOB|nr:DUF4241 domain-containing protein [Paracoccus lutimaris]RCW85793.1 uncharacterized protein DUF4241 [Paracoccus lutimaris]
MNAGLALLLIAATAGGAMAQDRPASVDWLIAASADPGRTVIDLGEYHLDGSGVVALDPLTGLATPPAKSLPTSTAQVHVIQAHQDGFDDTAALMLTLGRGKPVCGVLLGGFGVDTGLAALANQSHAEKLDGYGRILDLAGSDLFTALEPQLPMEEPAGFVTLPEGTRFPVSRSGYGDGAYHLFRLNDAQDAPVALYIDFIGDRKGEWIDPPPCANV